MVVTSCKGNVDGGTKTDSKEAKELLIDKDIEETNTQFPMPVDIATTAVSVSRDGDVVIYHFEVNEGLLEIESFIENQETMKSELRKSLVDVLNQDPSFREIMNLMKETGKCLKYEYKGSKSGKTMVIEFTTDEISEMLGEE